MKREVYLLIRGAADRLIAALLFVVASPVMGIIAIVILLRMGRPILFHQDRLGRHGRVFRIVKFRTMVRNAESLGGGYFPAEMNLVPRVGRLLRRTSLDELPQLLNVVRGEMSFVGPRPALVPHLDRYTPQQVRRLEVPQGITGLAQVAYRNDAPWSKRIELDVRYADIVGPRVDFLILLRTIRQVLGSNGVLEAQTAAEVDDLAPPSKRRD